MKFYLDKEQAKQGTACCYWKSETNTTEEELKLVRKHFKFEGEFLIFEGIDIPHKFKYNEELDTIEEVIEIIENTPQTLSDEVKEIESEFDESVEIEPEIFYFYISKEYADTRFIAKNIATFDQPVKYPEKFFTEETYMVRGKSVPYYITVQNNVVREATEYEKYTRGQRKLSENEVVLKEEIIALEDGQYLDEEKQEILEDGQYLDEEKQEIITVPCPEEYLVKEWHRNTHIWEDLTTDLDRVQAQYRDYKSLDTPLSFIEMEEQGIKDEYVNMMKELQELTIVLEVQKANAISTLTDVNIIKPSEKLEAFKNKFKKFF